jgi:hypothetical protein
MIESPMFLPREPFVWTSGSWRRYTLLRPSGISTSFRHGHTILLTSTRRSAAMATLNSESAMHELPAELLEKILLEVIGNGAPQYERTSREESLRLFREEIEPTSASLAFRATCIIFRDLSWRAFARTIDHTVFGLASKCSVENLKAVSDTKYLTPWITRLSITFRVVEPRYPWTLYDNDEEMGVALRNIDPRARQMFYDIKDDEKAWHPEIGLLWSDVLVNGELPEGDVGLARNRTRSLNLETTLAPYLERFKNLDELRYLHTGPAAPGTYRKFFQQATSQARAEASKVFPGYGLCVLTDLNAHLGLEIMLNSCVQAGLQPRILELAVDLDEHHAFITDVPETVIVDFCKKVEDLSLYDNYCPFYDGEDGQVKQPRVAITKTIFPALRSLTIDHRNLVASPYISVAPLPPSTDIPTLSHLEVHKAKIHETSLLAFITRYGQVLETVSLEGMQGNRYESILSILERKDLKQLTITHETSEYWEAYKKDPGHPRWRDDDNDVEGLLRDLQKDRLKGLAEEVVLLPPELVEAVERFRKLDIEDESGSEEEIEESEE